MRILVDEGLGSAVGGRGVKMAFPKRCGVGVTYSMAKDAAAALHHSMSAECRRCFESLCFRALVHAKGILGKCILRIRFAGGQLFISVDAFLLCKRWWEGLAWRKDLRRTRAKSEKSSRILRVCADRDGTEAAASGRWLSGGR